MILQTVCKDCVKYHNFIELPALTTLSGFVYLNRRSVLNMFTN